MFQFHFEAFVIGLGDPSVVFLLALDLNIFLFDIAQFIGKIIHFNGNPWTFEERFFIASNGVVHDALIALVVGDTPAW